jgi:hypothetical protein
VHKFNIGTYPTNFLEYGFQDEDLVKEMVGHEESQGTTTPFSNYKECDTSMCH